MDDRDFDHTGDSGFKPKRRITQSDVGYESEGFLKDGLNQMLGDIDLIRSAIKHYGSIDRWPEGTVARLELGSSLSSIILEMTRVASRMLHGDRVHPQEVASIIRHDSELLISLIQQHGHFRNWPQGTATEAGFKSTVFATYLERRIRGWTNSTQGGRPIRTDSDR